MDTQSSSPPSGAAPENPPPAGQARLSGPGGADVFDRIRDLGVVRPDEGRWAAGVCAGLARRWGLDPLLVRGLFVAVSIVGGFGLALYGVLWLLLPHPDGRIHAQQVMHGVVTRGFIGSLVFILCGLPLHNGTFGFGFAPFGGLTFVALIGFGIWWLATRGSRTSGSPAGPGGPSGAAPSGSGEQPASAGDATASSPAPGHGPYGSTGYGPTGYGPTGYGSTGYGPTGFEPTGYGPPGYRPPRYGSPGTAAENPTDGYGQERPWASPSDVRWRGGRQPDLHAPSHAITRSTLGLALIAAAAVLVWGRFGPGLPGPSGLIAAAVALGVIALGLVLAGARGRRGGGLAPIAIVLALATAAGTAAHAAVTRDYGRQTWIPVAASVAENGYRLGGGRAVIDLTQPALIRGAGPTSAVTVPVQVGAGDVIVVVPTTTPTTVTADVGLGDITDRIGSQGDRGGAGVSMTVAQGGTPLLVVTVKVGVGHVEIVPEGAVVHS